MGLCRTVRSPKARRIILLRPGNSETRHRPFSLCGSSAIVHRHRNASDTGIANENGTVLHQSQNIVTKSRLVAGLTVCSVEIIFNITDINDTDLMAAGTLSSHVRGNGVGTTRNSK